MLFIVLEDKMTFNQVIPYESKKEILIFPYFCYSGAWQNFWYQSLGSVVHRLSHYLNFITFRYSGEGTGSKIIFFRIG